MPTDGEKSGFVVKNINANFLGMAKLGDMLEVESRVVKEKSASVLIHQEIFKEEKKIFEMDLTLVFVRNGRPNLIPPHLQNLF